ncbi:MAG: phytoene desaturase [Frankiaceae bacterium]|nr:phytoene desaturase [Frankiaceae bacterium]MBV9872703.1 phytoene desaturase [Frankiaceae bacterium]
MRTVTGRTDHVVIVGAGLGGLSAALRLAGAGRRVTILERELTPGGRAGQVELDGYRFDTGPTVLTMPDLIADAFACVDEDMADWIDLHPVEPAYRASFADGSNIDVVADVDAMADQIAATCGAAEAAGYRRFVDFARRLYALERKDFIDRNLDSPFDLVRPSLARLAALGGFRRLAPKVASYLKDERLQRIFTFQSMYAGMSPYDALAIYAVIAYMDCVEGVFFPTGGIHAVPAAMAGAAEKNGVAIRYGTEVARVEVVADRAVAVHTRDGERVPADVVVLNPDLPVAWRELLPAERRPRRLERMRYSPSCFLLLAGSRLPDAGEAHHTIHFGKAWRSTFRELVDDKALQSDPSLFVSTASVSDRSLAPAGRSTRYVLVPTPNLQAGIDWDVVGPRYRDEVVARLEGLGYERFGDSIDVETTITPADWGRRGMAHGTPFAASHSFFQTGPFRPGNLAYDNVVFVGSGTQPGVGVPMVLISGRLAAERIVKADVR